jgi:hypothetical protein
MSSESTPLDRFVRAALEKGEGRDAISAALQHAGWPAQEVTSALAAYAVVPFSVPVPRPRASLSSRETFLYLVLFTALYLSIWNFGALLFELIDRAFPDAAQPRFNYGGDSLSSIRWSVSSLIIAFPVFLWTGNYIGKRVAENPARRLSPARRWCTYITLFIAVAVLIGGATSLIDHLLGGEVTIRIALKGFVTAVIACSTLLYYLRDLRHEESETT